MDITNVGRDDLGAPPDDLLRTHGAYGYPRPTIGDCAVGAITNRPPDSRKPTGD